MTFFQKPHFVGTPPRVRDNRKSGRQCIRFQTYRHPEFKFDDSLFYTVDRSRREKRVAENIGGLLTARALAYWDDGTYKFNRSQNGKRYYILNTQSFIFEDQKIQALKDHFEIDATIQKVTAYYRLYIREKSRFVDLIRPYIHPCFDYKIQNTGHYDKNKGSAGLARASP